MLVPDLIASLQRRIDAFEHGDPGGVLDEQASVDGADLWQQAAGPLGGVPFEVAQVLAWLHWCRYLSLLDGQSRDRELRNALMLFAPIANDVSAPVPELVLQHLADDANARTDPDRMARTAMKLLQQVTYVDDPSALSHVIDLLSTAVAATPRDHRNLALHTNSLSLALQTRFGRTGNPADLNQAIIVSQQAVDTMSDEDPRLTALILTGLGEALKTRFEQTDSLTDLNQAITSFQQVVTITPDNHPDKIRHISTYGFALLVRFARIGISADLDATITATEQAISSAPEGDMGLPACFSCLSGALSTRSQRSGSHRDLDRAIVMAREAVAWAHDRQRQRVAESVVVPHRGADCVTHPCRRAPCRKGRRHRYGQSHLLVHTYASRLGSLPQPTGTLRETGTASCCPSHHPRPCQPRRSRCRT